MNNGINPEPIRFLPNIDILEHGEKHEQQVRVTRLQDDLELHNLCEDEIAKKSFSRLKELKKKTKISNTFVQSTANHLKETHAIAIRKLRQMEGLAKALDINIEKRPKNIQEKPQRFINETKTTKRKLEQLT